MKKTLYHLCWIIAMAVVTTSCEKANNSLEADNTSVEAPGSFKLNSDLGGVSPGSCVVPKNYANYNFAGLTAEVARNLSGDYRQLNQPKLAINGSIPDARSIWFSLETLKAYIWKIEQEVCARSCSTNLNLGIRIYYGRYPTAGIMASTPDLSGLPSNYEEHHTAFLVPTYRDQMNPNIQWDFDPWHWGSANCMPRSFRSWFSGEGFPFRTEKSLILSPSEAQNFAITSPNNPLNHGGLIPPDPDEGTGF